MAGIELDGANQKVVLDSDGDTYLEAATDDTIKVYVAGAHDATISANAINVLSGTTLTIDSGATITNSGTANGFSSADPASADGDSLGTASLEWSDLFLADGGIIKFGNDQDTLLTHTDGTGLTLNSTNKLCFNDATQFIQGASGTVLDIAATDEIELTATLIEAVGRLEVTGGAIFNEASADVDFRIESNGNANMFFVDGGDNTIKIASPTNVAGLGVNPHLQVSASSPFISINTASADAGSGALIFTKGRSATVGTATAVQDNDSLGGIFWAAADGTDFTSAAASIKANINGTPGGNDVPGEIVFATTADGAASATDRLTLDAAGDANFTGNITLDDDKGIILGTGSDMSIGTTDGEDGVVISKGSTTTGGTAGTMTFLPTTDGIFLSLVANEGKGPAMQYVEDDGDDNGDTWRIGQGMDGDANTSFNWTNNVSGSIVAKMRLGTGGVLQHAGTISSSHSFDYAEYWPWKTELANDDKITETYGMTVVLDGATVRLAETGEEAKVIGVVRPNNTSTVVGGDGGLYYKDKYEKNVWGETQEEEYTQVTWEDTYNNVAIKHSYMKDRIPAKRIRNGAVQTQENWHTLESNFLKDDDGNFVTLVVPSTDDEKTAANYVERSTYKKDKGEHKKDDKLMRPKINSSYDYTKTYKDRSQRRKEWCIVGLMGQVEIRNTAIVPTSWTKMKNLETGIDLYYIK